MSDVPGGPKLLDPCNWSCEWLWATTWVLATKPGSPIRTMTAFNHWAIYTPVSFCKHLFLFMCMCPFEYMPCMFIYSQRPEEGFSYPEAGVTGDHEAPSGCWELNWGPLEEHWALLAAQPSLQAQSVLWKSWVCSHQPHLFAPWFLLRQVAVLAAEGKRRFVGTIAEIKA